MKNQRVSRRRFLAIWGGGIAGIWFAGTGLVSLPAEMVFAMSGSCSFCGKEAREIFGLAGVTHRNGRVCNECIELCFDILAEEIGIGPPAPSHAESNAVIPEAALTDSQLLDELSRHVAAGKRGDPLVDALAAALAQYEEMVTRPSSPTPRIEDLACSFCDKNQREVAKLIAGPTVYICDGCVGDAGALFMRYGWRPGA